MTRRLVIRAGDDTVTGRLAIPDSAGGAGIVLAHGAGAGQDHPWMVGMRDALAGLGHPVLTFNYPYTEAGRSTPDRALRLMAVHLAALRRMTAYSGRFVAAGKSMGGRMASHVVADLPVDDALRAQLAGLAYFAYPLVPLGTGAPRPVDHLVRVGVPQLFMSGTRDRLSPPDLISGVAAGLPDATLAAIDDADHGFHVPRATGLTDTDVIGRLAAVTSNWIEQH